MESSAVPDGIWPMHLQPGALRWTRTSGHYDETVTFYRDVVGLPVVGSFTASFGEDGTIFGLPDTGTQMEIVRAHDDRHQPDGFDQLVFYLVDSDAVRAATETMRERGLQPDPALHPYWKANGAVMYVDPDGRGVVYAPWVYGRVPDPVDRPSPGAATGGFRVELYAGSRDALRPLFALAEDSSSQLDSYLGAGRVLVAADGDEVIGHLQLVDTDRPGEVEIKNMAVREGLQGRGVGGRLVRAAIELVTRESGSLVLVATAAADVDNLRFYQRRGFRMRSIERDAFTAENGYSPDVQIDGIRLCDRVWLDYPLE
ncbi:MAG: GNAT family N-acetyltransferase [Actinomycetes bacterium]